MRDISQRQAGNLFSLEETIVVTCDPRSQCPQEQFQLQPSVERDVLRISKVVQNCVLHVCSHVGAARLRTACSDVTPLFCSVERLTILLLGANSIQDIDNGIIYVWYAACGNRCPTIGIVARTAGPALGTIPSCAFRARVRT